jgi:ubiquinone/menaquinone biosynthesis C-methylase UbiE
MSERTDVVWSDASLATVYLEGVRGAIPLANQQIDVMLRLIAARGCGVRRFLDLGCGDGILANAVLSLYPEAEAVLMDFNPTMLEAAGRRFAAASASVQLLNVDYGDPAWVAQAAALGPFDAIVSGFSIHHQPDARKREIYGEIYHLLSPGGVFVHVEHVSSASNWIREINDELFVDSLHAHHRDQPREQVAALYYNRPDKSANLLAPLELQCEWLREIGFTDVDCYCKIFELAVFGGRRR